MSVIYEPKGKAREYSPLACNLYTGCNHGCKYCYAPSIRRMKRDDYKTVVPRRNIMRDFERECKKHIGTDSNMLFCFMTDPYNAVEKELQITRNALKVALAHEIPVAVLTKSNLILRDIDILKKYGSHVKAGMTLTFSDESKSIEWEPEAATPSERIAVLRQLKEAGIRTWASFEPVIDPQESLDIMKKSLPYVDMYKVGKLNNFQGIDKSVDWSAFLKEAVEILRGSGKQFYVKKDLREAATDIRLYGNEVLHDDLQVPGFRG